MDLRLPARGARGAFALYQAAVAGYCLVMAGNNPLLLGSLALIHGLLALTLWGPQTVARPRNGALRALRALDRAEPRADGKPRLAFVAPLPPQRSGIATYSTELLMELTAHADIELVAAQDEVRMPPSLAHLPLRSAAWFDEHGAGWVALMSAAWYVRVRPAATDSLAEEPRGA